MNSHPRKVITAAPFERFTPPTSDDKRVPAEVDKALDALETLTITIDAMAEKWPGYTVETADLGSMYETDRAALATLRTTIEEQGARISEYEDACEEQGLHRQCSVERFVQHHRGNASFATAIESAGEVHDLTQQVEDMRISRDGYAEMRDRWRAIAYRVAADPCIGLTTEEAIQRAIEAVDGDTK